MCRQFPDVPPSSSSCQNFRLSQPAHGGLSSSHLTLLMCGFSFLPPESLFFSRSFPFQWNWELTNCLSQKPKNVSLIYSPHSHTPAISMSRQCCFLSASRLFYFSLPRPPPCSLPAYAAAFVASPRLSLAFLRSVPHTAA